MPHPKLTGEEITQRGKALYQTQIRAQVETTENIGKIASPPRPPPSSRDEHSCGPTPQAPDAIPLRGCNCTG